MNKQIEINKSRIIKFLKDKNFVRQKDFNSFMQFDRKLENKYKIISVIIMENKLYIMLHTIHTNDYFFSKYFMLDVFEQELNVLLKQMETFISVYEFLF